MRTTLITRDEPRALLEMADDDVPLPPRDPNKTSWPEVLGWPELNAAFRICYDRPEVTVYFFDVGDTRPPGYNPTRVVVFVDANLRVALTPLLG